MLTFYYGKGSLILVPALREDEVQGYAILAEFQFSSKEPYEMPTVCWTGGKAVQDIDRIAKSTSGP